MKLIDKFSDDDGYIKAVNILIGKTRCLLSMSIIKGIDGDQGFTVQISHNFPLAICISLLDKTYMICLGEKT